MKKKAKRLFAFLLIPVLCAGLFVQPVSADQEQGTDIENTSAWESFFNEVMGTEFSEVLSTETVSGDGTVSGGGIPTPDPDPVVTRAPRIYVLDDAAHQNAELLPSVEGVKNKLIRSFQQTELSTMVRRGYKVAYWHLYQQDATGAFVETASIPAASVAKKAYNNYRITYDVRFVAEWSTTPYKFTIKYNLDGGSFKESDVNSGKVPSSFTVEDGETIFPEPVKAGCFFAGFYEDAALTRPLASIPAGSFIDSGDAGVPALQVYAKWVKATAGDVTIKSLKYTKTGTVTLSCDPADGADSYEVSYSTSAKFKKKKTASFITKDITSVKITNLKKGSCFVRVRAICKDSTGAKANGRWSKAASVKVTKGVKEVKAKKGKIKLKKVKILDGELSITAKSAKRLKSSDASYYLVTVDPSSGKVLKKISALAKTKTITASVPLKDDSGKNLIQGKFAIAIKKGKKYKVMSSAAFIDNPEAVATITDPFPTPVSKKGLQGEYAGRVKHTFGNMLLNSYIDVGKNASNAYKYNGKTYYFDKAKVRSLTNWAKSCNRAGIVCTAQFMLTWPGPSYSYLVAPAARDQSKKYFVPNGTDQKARETWEAMFTCIAEDMADQGAHLDNWILGNEVNVGNEGPGWFYHGNMNMSGTIKHYAAVYRCMYYAVKSNIANARTYICTDHTFNDRNGDWGAKPFMNQFDKTIKKENKNIQWNLAYHAYPSILTVASTWNDVLVSNNESSEFVTPRNLEVLTGYVKKHFGSNTRIILSEQGFTAKSGEDVQAAAVAYTYYKAEFNDMIDAVIFRSSVDEPSEAAQGLLFGLSNRPKTWQMFTYMDSPKSLSYTTPYLKTINNASSWASIIPNFDEKKFATME